jgi:hypothetical protein
VRTQRHTLAVTKADGAEPEYVLHDSIRDPSQLLNIATDQPQVVRELVETELEPRLEMTGDPWLTS